MAFTLLEEVEALLALLPARCADQMVDESRACLTRSVLRDSDGVARHGWRADKLGEDGDLAHHALAALVSVPMDRGGRGWNGKLGLVFFAKQ